MHFRVGKDTIISDSLYRAKIVVCGNEVLQSTLREKEIRLSKKGSLKY